MIDLINLGVLVSAFANIFLGILVYSKRRKSLTHKHYFYVALSVFAWAIGMFSYRFVGSVEYSILWCRILYVAPIFIVINLVFFSYVFPEEKDLKNIFKQPILIFGYILSIICLFTPLIVSNVLIRSGEEKIIIWGNLYYFYTFFISGFFSWCYVKLIRKILVYKGLVREQLLYTFWGILLGSFFAMITNLLMPTFGRFEYNWFGQLCGFILVSFIAYAIVTRHLMNIKLVLRQWSVFLVSLILTVVPIFILKYSIQVFLPDYAFWLEIILLMIAASIFPIFRNYFYKVANKYFFSSLYDSKDVIKVLSDKLGSTLETGTIYQTVTDILSGAMHMKAVSFLTCSPKAKDVKILFNSGLKVPEGLKSDLACKVIYGAYAGVGKMLVLDELKTRNSSQDRHVVKALTEAGAEVLVPLTVKDKSVGIIALGPKESNEIYNKEDLELLKIVGTQTAISLENALLYEETKTFNVKLVKEVDKATKELKQANEELKTLDRAKSDFISIASHQLRTPLTVIKGYGSMMLEGAFGKMPKTIEDNLQKIYDSNERLIALVEDLLNISRIESGRLQFNFEMGQLEEMVASVTEELTPNAVKKGLTFKYNKPKKALPALKMDKTKLRQVVINLIDNSIKYTEKGGLTVDLSADDKVVKFCVSDTGMGIRADELPNLFKKFSRGEETSIIHTEGTGLGLYVGKMMIEAHGGKIWAESEGEGKGARFCFEIPIVPPATPPAIAKPQAVTNNKVPISNDKSNPKLK